MSEVAAENTQEVKPKKTRGNTSPKPAAPEGAEKAPRKERAPRASNLPKREPTNVDKIVGEITDSSKITWLVKENPRAQRGATFTRFAGYFGAETVAEYKSRGGHMGDLRWDLRHKYLSIEDVTLVPVEKKPEQAAEQAAETAAEQPQSELATVE